MTDADFEKMQATGLRLMERIKAECDDNPPPHMVEVVLADSDTDAQAEGWPDRALQQVAVEQLMLALPEGYKSRVRVVSKPS
jgi:hypothetical protein